MSTSTTIKLAEKFETPGHRYKSSGDYSGEEFREDFLVPALRAHDSVTVDLSNIVGMPSGFAEEAFGGIIRHYNFSYDDLKKKLQLTALEDESWEDNIAEIWGYIDDAEQFKNELN